MSDQPDLDERFTLHPQEPEEVLRRLLNADAPECDDEDESTTEDES